MSTPLPLSASSSSSPNSLPITTEPFSNAQSLVVINVAAQAPLKLTDSNYFSWKAQFDALLVGYDLYGYVNGTLPCPPAEIGNPATLNPAHTFWVRQDKLILSALLASLSKEILHLVTSSPTSKLVWTKLATTYAKPSWSCLLCLRERLIKPQGSRPIMEYLTDIKGAANEYSLLSTPLDDNEIILYIINGLSPDLKDISAAVRTRDKELFEKLVEQSAFLQRSAPPSATSPLTANDAQRSGYSNSRKGPSFRRSQPQNSGFQNSSPHPPSSHGPPTTYKGTCQLCRQQGHSARYCSYLWPQWTYSPSSSQQKSPVPLPPQAFYTRSTSSSLSALATQSNWLIDSGASHHVATDLQNLSLHSEYDGTDVISVGNGNKIPITHTGSTMLSSPTRSFLLFDVLCVPDMKRNLLSVSKFCNTNNASVEFLPDCFVVKDMQTGSILLRGPLREGIYE